MPTEIGQFGPISVPLGPMVFVDLDWSDDHVLVEARTRLAGAAYDGSVRSTIARLHGQIRHYRRHANRRQPGETLSSVYLWLTPEEAKEQMDTLEQLLRDGDYTAHHHASAADFQTEVTVMLDRA